MRDFGRFYCATLC